MDDVEAVISHITREATVEVGSLFSVQKSTHGGEDIYHLLWGIFRVAEFLVVDNDLVLSFGEHDKPIFRRCNAKISLVDPDFDISPIIGALRRMVRDERIPGNISIAEGPL